MGNVIDFPKAHRAEPLASAIRQAGSIGLLATAIRRQNPLLAAAREGEEFVLYTDPALAQGEICIDFALRSGARGMGIIDRESFLLSIMAEEPAHHFRKP